MALMAKLRISRMANCVPSRRIVLGGSFIASGITQHSVTVIRNPGLPADFVSRVKSNPELLLTSLDSSAEGNNISTPDVMVANSSSAIKPGIFLTKNVAVSI